MTSPRTIADDRLAAGTAATLTATFRDQHGESAAPAGTVTVKVTRADGTTLLAAGTATGTDGYARTVALTAAQTATLDTLTATWTDGGNNATITTRHDIAGGFYFTLAEVRAGEAALATGYSTDQLVAGRRAVEDEFEGICGVAFVPRFRRVTLDGTGRAAILCPDPMLRTVRSVTIDGTALDADALAGLALTDSGLLTRTDGGLFTAGAGNVTVGYEHGYDRPPAEIRRYAMKRLRQVMTESASAVPARATSFQVGDTGVFRLATASRWQVGDPDIDGALARWAIRPVGVA